MVRVHRRFVADLETRRGIDRQLEVLPDKAGFAALESAGQGLTGPELATLVAHAKLDLHARVLASDLPDTAAFSSRLPEYFPRPLRERFPEAIADHPLRREILTTLLVNETVDAAGMTYAFRMETSWAQPGRLGAGVLGRHRGVRAARAVGAPVLPADPHRGLGPGGARVAAAARPRRALVPHQPAPAPGRRIDHHPLRRAVRALRGRLPELLVGRECAEMTAAAAKLETDGVPPSWRWRPRRCWRATGCSTSSNSSSWLTGRRSPREPFEVARLYYAMSEHLGISVALTAVSGLERGDRWHSLARLALRDDLYSRCAR
jgi:glutamate dehydrogenase